MNIFAVIVAAGSSERFESDAGLKQLAPLAGMPMLAWPIKRLGDRRNITGIVCVVPPGNGDAIRSGVTAFGGGDIDAWVDGGVTRQDSVRNGLAALPDDATHVLIHDAARPCVTSELLSRLTTSLQKNDAVVPTVRGVDTLVRETGGRVRAIVDRAHIAGVQTPQAFELALIRRAHEHALHEGIAASDDGSLVLSLGGSLATVPGERTNIKVTYPEDLVLAEAIIREMTRT